MQIYVRFFCMRTEITTKKRERGASQQRVPSQNTKPYEITFRRCDFLTKRL